MVGPLEIGANYILKHPPEKVGCVIEDLARLFQSDFSVPAIRISYVIHGAFSSCTPCHFVGVILSSIIPIKISI